MCDPTGGVATMAILSAISALATYQSQSAAADAQNEYQDDMAEQQNDYMVANAEAANKALTNDMQQESLRMRQGAEASSEELQSLQRSSLEAAGTAQASGAGNNVIRDIFRDEARSSGQIKTNLAWEQEQSRMSLKSMQATALSRIRSVRPYTPQYAQGPSGLQLATKLGAAGTQGYMGYQDSLTPKGD